MKNRLFFLLYMLLVSLLLCACDTVSPPERETVRIAIPSATDVVDMDTNYYKLWLEEKTGLAIEFELISSDQTEEYLRLLFSSGNSDLDAVFFSPQLRLSDEVIGQYGMQGHILPLDAFMDAGETNIGGFFEGFREYDLRAMMSADDGHIYYMPSLNTAQLTQNTQVLWLNTDWLGTLGASIPQTTEDLSALLEAFATADPNRNGLKDELPLMGSGETWQKQVCNHIINAFVYNDPENSRVAVREGKVVFAPTTDEYRNALIYLNRLYQGGLLPRQSFSFTEHQLTQLVCDPRNAVGGFASGSITDVIYAGSTEVLSSYIHVAPLKGPQGARHSVPSTPLPLPGGVITATCKNPQAVFGLMDLMLSREGSLIACYGEEGVDWEHAGLGDLSITGEPAVLNIKTRLANGGQNKHLSGLGPMIIRGEYADAVSWSGMEADNEYIDSRAAMAYQPWEPAEYVPVIYFDSEDADRLRTIRGAIDAYTDQMLTAFVTGQSDPENDDDWRQYVSGYERLELDRFLEAVQASYDNLLEWRAAR